jgi:tellurite methyltransferase
MHCASRFFGAMHFNYHNHMTWSQYAELKKNSPPNPLLLKAIKHVQCRLHALDLGSGALNDSIYLLQNGFEHVVAVDQSNIAQNIYDTLPVDRVRYVISTFDNFEFPNSSYDLINAQFALPFNPPDTFDAMFEKLKASLAPHGLFVGNLFGIKDDWNIPASGKTFHNAEQVRGLLEGLQVLYLEEKEEDSYPVIGPKKHWHLFDIIAKKI